MTKPTTETPAYPMVRGCPFDPPSDLAQLQREAPISKVRIWDGSTPWLISRYEDVRAVLGDPRVSSDIDLPGYPRVSAGIAARPDESKTFVNLDEPAHSAQRRALTSDFRVKKMEELRPRIQSLVDGLIDDLLAGPQPADLVSKFALPLPSMVICELLGVPYEDRTFFHKISNTIISRDSTPEESVKAFDDVLAYLIDLLDRKDADPVDDVFSHLAVEQMRTGKLSRRELGPMAALLLVAGHETTASMIALGVATLFDHPDQLKELRETDDPALVASAVEELLRYLSIVHAGRRRVALEDLEVGGQLIRKGEGIIASIDIANRDQDAMTDPDHLDIHRGTRDHVAFGYGVHQCLGQPLARIELQVVFGTLFRRIPTLALAVPEDELEFKPEGEVYGMHALPVRW
ncbi:MAG TPA: cytochrome P450 [Pseudonocardiaceae bacterium]